MPVTINRDGSITGLSVGGLGSGVVDTATLANGAAVGSKLGTGAVLQVKQTVKTDTSTATAVDTWEDIPGLSATITPISTSNKILVQATCEIALNNGGYYVLRLERGGSPIATGDAAGNRTLGFHGTYRAGMGTYFIEPSSINFLDSPNTTSATTYNVAWFVPTTETTLRVINRTHDDANGDFRFRTLSTITLTEIAG